VTYTNTTIDHIFIHTIVVVCSNPTMKNHPRLFKPLLITFLVGFSLGLLQAQTTNTNNLTVLGYLDVTNNIFFGTTATNQSAALLSYTETNHTIGFISTQSSTAYLWQDNGGTNSKLLLDGSNNLTLYGTNRSAGITFNPNSGGITLSGTGAGLTLSDGTVLSNSNSLHSKALYDANGNAQVSFGANGNLIVGAPIALTGTGVSSGISFGSGNTLNANNVSYLNKTLQNLGYRTNTASSASSFSLPRNFSVASVAGDTSGNSYIAGGFSGSGTFGSTILTAVGYQDIFVIKLNSSGVVQWARSFGGAGGWDSVATPNGIAVDASGNVTVAGDYYGPITSGLPQALSNTNGADEFVVQYNSSGTVQWAKAFGGGEDYLAGLGVDGGGNIYVYGYCRLRITAGLPQPLMWGDDQFLIKYNSSGTVQWARSFGGLNDGPVGIAVDSDGNSYLSGHRGLEPFYLHGIKIGDHIQFIIKYNSNGVVQWAKSFGGQFYFSSSSKAIAVDANGNAYVTGSYSDDFDDVGLPRSISWDDGNSFIIKFNTSGAVQWASTFFSTEYLPMPIAVDGNGNTFVTGNSGSQIFVNAFNSDGTSVWTKRFGTLGTQEGGSVSSIATTGNGNVVITGTAANNINIGDQVIATGPFVYSGRPSDYQYSGASSASGLSWGGSKATTNGAIALGQNALASSQGAVALGGGESSGSYSFSSGIATKSDGYGSVAFGVGNTATGQSATAFGSSSTATGQSATAFGSSSTASGDYSTAIGNGTRALSFSSLSFGQYNVGLATTSETYNYNDDGELVGISNGQNSWVSTDPVLEIGNGVGGSRGNAVTIFKSGNLRTAGTIESQAGIRVPQTGDLGMGVFTNGNNPSTLVPSTGLLYPNGQ